MSTPTVRKRRNGLRSPVAARKRIGREIAQVRKDKGYTQAGLASLIGSSRRTLSRVENGEPGIALDTYAAISDQIGPLQNFRHGTPPPPDLSTYASWTTL